MYEFKNKSETVFAPLAGELFNFPFVKEVFMNTNYISITKKDSYNWQEFSNELREYIRNYIEEGKTIFKDEILQKEVKRYNKEYINVEFKDFNSESSYEVSGLWESIDDAKGGPFKGYLFYDYENDRTF